MSLSRPEHFETCFPRSMWNDKMFINYIRLITLNHSKTPTLDKPEKHHIVPREWLSWNVDDFNFWTEDRNNVVYLSVKDKILALQYLCIIFLEMHDGTTYKGLSDSFARRYHLKKFQFWRDPYSLTPEMVSHFEKVRCNELKNKKPYTRKAK